MKPCPRTLSRILLAIAFIAAGANHFRDPATYLSMMPPWLPFHETLNLISGAAEIAGGVGLLLPKFRNAAGIGLILLLIAIFPANIHIALNGWPGMDIPRWVLWARLPFQLLFIAWVVFSCPGLPAYLRGLMPARIFRNK
ncbi:DoxX family protein [Akkermansiaceae bacterium]|nr:DoxX family protein [Akkermansiaceae bacterium]